MHRMHANRVAADLTRERQAEASPSVPYDVQVNAHVVNPAVSGAHAHEHAHSTRSLSSKFAAHDHSHRHDGDPQADKESNGHTHATPHARLPWESRPEPAS